MMHYQDTLTLTILSVLRYKKMLIKTAQTSHSFTRVVTQ